LGQTETNDHVSDTSAIHLTPEQSANPGNAAMRQKGTLTYSPANNCFLPTFQGGGFLDQRCSACFHQAEWHYIQSFPSLLIQVSFNDL
jgi:hypothetical protein